jgi:hypothetical protein
MPRHETATKPITEFACYYCCWVLKKKTGNFTASYRHNYCTLWDPSIIISALVVQKFERPGKNGIFFLLLARKTSICPQHSWGSLSERPSRNFFRRNSLSSRLKPPPPPPPVLKSWPVSSSTGHWAQERKDWATADWKRFCFADESTFEIGKPNRSLRVRRYPGE